MSFCLCFRQSFSEGSLVWKCHYIMPGTTLAVFNSNIQTETCWLPGSSWSQKPGRCHNNFSWRYLYLKVFSPQIDKFYLPTNAIPLSINQSHSIEALCSYTVILNFISCCALKILLTGKTHKITENYFYPTWELLMQITSDLALHWFGSSAIYPPCLK